MKKLFNRLFLGLGIGLIAGLSVTGFLHSLHYVTSLFHQFNWLVFTLPISGGLSLWLYCRYGRMAHHGSHLLIEVCHTPKNQVPLIMAPLIYVTTLLSHLSGASVGREASAVQISASLNDWLAKRLNIVSAINRRAILVASMGAGFGAAIGAPLAGFVFGFEVLHIKGFKAFALLESLIASFVAYGITHLLKAPHTLYPQIDFSFSLELLLYLILSAVLYGLLTRAFVYSYHYCDLALTKIFTRPMIKLIVGSI